MSKFLRGARVKGMRKDVVEYISSAEADARIADAVVKINLAHVIMLAKQRIIPRADATRIVASLLRLEDKVQPSVEFEDVHMQVEELVSADVEPDVAGNMHLAKSRNDQVATAIRMVLRDELLTISDLMLTFIETLVRIAKHHTQTLFPAYTHLQPAQPSTYAHFLLAHASAFTRDLERLTQLYARVNQSPMGAGAVVGTSFPINRELVADLLGFDGIIENSLDASTTRDFALETQAVLSIIGSNVSRLCQDLVFLSSSEVAVIDLPDEFSSTSSIMPQKKNPDALEVMRARSSKLFGNLGAMSTILHGLPSGYSLDLQEITPMLWESVNMTKDALKLLPDLAASAKVRKDLESRPDFRLTTATELASVLVRESRIPFREAHRIVGLLVREHESSHGFATLTLDDLRAAAKEASNRTITLTSAQLIASTDPMKCVEVTNSVGGPSPIRIKATIDRISRLLRREREILDVRVGRLTSGNAKLEATARRFS